MARDQSIEFVKKAEVKFTSDDIAHLLWVEATRRLGIENSELEVQVNWQWPMGGRPEALVVLTVLRKKLDSALQNPTL